MAMASCTAPSGCRTSVRVDATSDGDEPVTGNRCTETGNACAAGTFCRFEAGTCDQPDREGTCTETPDACPEIFAPVCGCDGITYPNSCSADVAGVSIDFDGEC